MKGSIIAVFSCSGKTHFVLNNFQKINCIDHDMYDYLYRGQLGEQWIDHYILRMKQLQEKFEYVFVNAIPEIISKIDNSSVIVYPLRQLRQEWIDRALKRGGESLFPKLLDEKWDKWVDSCDNNKMLRIHLNSGQYLSDVNIF